MAFRERPYSAFNFLVNFGPDKLDPKAGFQEVSGLGMEITVAGVPRRQQAGQRARTKSPASTRCPTSRCKRGVMGDDTLYALARRGPQGQAGRSPAHRHHRAAQRGRRAGASRGSLKGARPIKYSGPALSGKATDVAVDELVLACEDITEETT